MKNTIVNLGLVAILASLVFFSGCINGEDNTMQSTGFTSQVTTDANSNYTQSDGRNYITLSVTTNASGSATNIYGALPVAAYIEKIDVNTGSLSTSTMAMTITDVQTGESILSLSSGVTNKTYYPRVRIENRTAESQLYFDRYFVAERINLNLQVGGATKTGTFKIFFNK